MTLIAPRRPVSTYIHGGRETYRDTGRPVDERLGTHVVLWIVDDPELWAKAIEAEVDAEDGRWPRKDRAAQVRADGPGRSWYAVHHSAQSAQANVESLRRSHPNPGVRYEVAEITAAGACPDCHQPTIQADGQWRHHFLRYPVECLRHPEPGPEQDDERQDGEWEISTRGYMICGYCNETVSWPQAILGYWELTGFHLLGVERATGTLVVLAEATSLVRGQTVHLPHHCQKIPDDVRATYAADIAAARGCPTPDQAGADDA